MLLLLLLLRTSCLILIPLSVSLSVSLTLSLYLFSKVIPEMKKMDKQNQFVCKRDLLTKLPAGTVL